MSDWTHIVASIDVDTYIESKNIKEEVEKLLEQAPRITGSEGNADIFVNVLSGHNTSTNCDCMNCEYGKTVIHYSEGGFSCDADEKYECPEGKYQTEVIITICGSLRDRVKSITEKEYNKFKNYLIKNCNFYIRNESVSFNGD